MKALLLDDTWITFTSADVKEVCLSIDDRLFVILMRNGKAYHVKAMFAGNNIE